LHILGKNVVTVFFGVFLQVPVGDRVRGRGDHREAMLVGDFADTAPERAQFAADLGDRITDPRADLDLRAQKLGRDLLADAFAAFLENACRRIVGQVAEFVGVFVEVEKLGVRRTLDVITDELPVVGGAHAALEVAVGVKDGIADRGVRIV